MSSGRGCVTAVTSEDPFGAGDPLEVARLVRRALAEAGRKAVDVTELMVVVDRAPSAEALARFTRRALGPHGSAVPSSTQVVESGFSHEERLAVTARSDARGASVVVVVLGPGDIASVCCLHVR